MPAGPAEDGKTQVYRTSTVSAIHLMIVFRAFDIGTRLFAKYYSTSPTTFVTFSFCLIIINW